MTRKFEALALAASTALILAGHPAAAATAGARARLQGFWEPRVAGSDGRAGDLKMPEQPVLTEAGKAEVAATRANGAAVDGVGVVSRYCLPETQPWNLMQSAPIDIVQDDRETTMMFEHHSVPFHIYTDGRGHPDAAHLKPQQNGHAIGRWEGDSFITDTIGFTRFSAPGLQGGAPKAATTHLVARFTPSADGKTLRGHFTVDDPVNLVKPYSWDFLWYRSEPGTYAALEECDPRDLGNSRY